MVVTPQVNLNAVTHHKIGNQQQQVRFIQIIIFLVFSLKHE